MDIAEFNALHMPALERNEVRHNLLLGLMQPSPYPADEMRRWTLGGDGASAIQTNLNRSIILGELNERQCHALAGQVYGSAFAGVLGTENTAARRGEPHFCVRQDYGLFVYQSAQSLFQPLLCKNRSSR